ncbi:TPX2 (targeting protein for Xklp2) proteinfamily [Striga asiatica]|uniref:TPX2 (Targeting protein for Xklp2) proteinfamily n=1 Tax=Striga asiatica TaxID=4170 RepID=A0A5A7QGN6_STRAF|nr:TPX2 (targeting protein for Xklp2) proteinfamily [Striga asiatica]
MGFDCLSLDFGICDSFKTLITVAKMAGEIQELIRHDFQAHSGSISFGRFEIESLCWERRSSFSHNRYLEEVEKYSKPGSVTEKKAYFEAHFKKKGILPLASPSETKYQTCEHNTSQKSCYDGVEINSMESAYGTITCEAQLESSCDGTELADSISEHGSVKESHCAEFESYSKSELKENLDDKVSKSNTSHVTNVTVGPIADDHAANGNCDANVKIRQASTSEVQSQVEYNMPRSSRPGSVVHRKSDISNKPSKVSEDKTNKTMKNVMRWEVENKASKADVQIKRQIDRNPRIECGSKAKGDYDIRRQIPRNRRVEKSLSTPLQKYPSRVHQIENRKKYVADKPQTCVHDDSNFRFKCNESVERRKEFDTKLEEKMHAKEANMHHLQAKIQEKARFEMKQLRNSLNFKAKPLPSFYHSLDKNKATVNNADPQRTRTNPSNIGTRVSRSSLLSTACKRDTSPSSPSAVINTLLDGKRETDKDKHKAGQIKNMDSGKLLETKMKKRTNHKTS